MFARICLFVLMIAVLTGCAQNALPVTVANVTVVKNPSSGPVVTMTQDEGGTYHFNLNGNLAKGEAYYVTIVAFKIEEDYGVAVDFREWLIRGNSLSYKPIAAHDVLTWEVAEVKIIELAPDGVDLNQISFSTMDDTLGDYIQRILDLKYGK